LKVERVSLALVGLLLGLSASGCREHNPAYLQATSPPDARFSWDAPWSPDGPSRDAKTADLITFFRDGSHADAGDANIGLPDATPDSQPGTVDGGGFFDVAPVDVRDARVARDTRNGDDGLSLPTDVLSEAGGTIDGAEDAPALLDVSVVDGAVVDAPESGVIVVLDAAAVDATLGLDGAADASPACQEGDTRSCSSSANPLVGACHAGTQSCTGGVWGACNGETLPTAEICNGTSGNGIDDNCNGITDEGCISDCVVVSRAGDDTTADGTAANPFATIQAAVDFAAQPDGGAVRRVCVSGGATCAAAFTYTTSTPLAMANGVFVQGNYALTGAGLTYCSDTLSPTTKIQFASSAQGVVFDSSITTHTELGGFAILRFSPANGATSVGPVSAVQVAGGRNITLSGIFVTDTPTADTTYGVDVSAGGQVTIVGSSIEGGQGRVTAIGVHVDGGSVILRNNCDGNPQGICQADCGAVGGSLGIRGRRGATAAADTSASSSAVVITNSSPSPAIPSTIVANTLCGGAGVTSTGGRGASVIAVQCDAGNCGTISGNSITGGRGAQVVALSISGAGSLVDSNFVNGGCGTDSTTGLTLANSSARVQNNQVFGGQCVAGNSSSTFVGLSIVLGPGSAEPDVHSNDIDPMGGTVNCQSTGVTIDRATGDNVPAGVLRNNIILAGTCATRFGVVESATATARLVENNDLYAQPSDLPSNTPAVLYHRADLDALTAMQVNALAGAAQNIASDPKFATYSTDLHLTATSPCIDEGTSAGAPLTDADGNRRPAGQGFDIGAYEFASP
jgi:hypothetical protein